MTKVLLLLRDPDLIRALKVALPQEALVESVRLPVCRLAETQARNQWVAEQFDSVSGLIQNQLNTWATSVWEPVTIVSELVDTHQNDISEVDPLHKSKAPDACLVLLLVVRFPEVHWLFDSCMDFGKCPLIRDVHLWNGSDRLGVSRRIKPFALPLFDPTGLRMLVLRQSFPRGGSLTTVKDWVPILVLDEEIDYSLFIGYCWFRAGYRPWVFTSWESLRSTNALLLAAGIDLSSGATTEDLYLNFPDSPENVHLSHLESRDGELPMLKSAKRRVFVTGGHSVGESRARWHVNRNYLARSDTSSKWILKPLRGIYGLLGDLGVNTRRQIKSNLAYSPDGRSHSSEGRLLRVSQQLLSNAIELMNSLLSVNVSIRAAVHAGEARRLLNARTPTVSLDAISLQHEGELTAECLFHGVQYHLDLKARFSEIRDDIAEVAVYLHGSDRVRSSLNARLSIAEALANRCRAYGQIEEELACLATARQLRFRAQARESLGGALMLPILSYYAFALSSLPLFAFLLGCWSTLFGILYFAVVNPAYPDVSLGDSMVASLLFSFTFMLPSNWSEILKSGHGTRETLWNLTLAAHGLVCFSNLSVMLSHFYLILARR